MMVESQRTYRNYELPARKDYLARNMFTFLRESKFLKRYMGNSMSNHPMISPTISDLSETLHTASPLLVYCILKVTAHFIGYFSRNSISNFQKFLKKFQNRTFLKFVPSKHFLITFLVNVQST